jgi:hypothetical protein
MKKVSVLSPSERRSLMEDLGPPDLKARRIEGELLGWDVSHILDGHAIPAYGNHTTRLDRARDRKLIYEALLA